MARFVGSGNVVVPIVDGANVVVMLAADTDNDTLTLSIAALPTSGFLSSASSGTSLSLSQVFSLEAEPSGSIYTQQVLYTPTDYASWTGDSFRYIVTDGGVPSEALVELVRYVMPLPPNVNAAFDEDTLSYIVLAKPGVTSQGKRNANFRVLITSLPTAGTLYQACFTPNGDNSYTALCAPGDGNALTPIISPNSLVEDGRGIVMFLPDPDASGSHFATFTYMFVDPDDGTLASSEANVSISINSVNDAPVGEALAATIFNISQPTTITLPAEDADEDRTKPLAYSPGFAPHPFARVTTFPRGGRLYQVNPDGSSGDLLDATVLNVTSLRILIFMRLRKHTKASRFSSDCRLSVSRFDSSQVPEVSQWVEGIVRYSSQFSRCNGGACFVWSGAEDTGCNQADVHTTSTCRGNSCAVAFGKTLSWGDSSCTDSAWHATQLVGEPNFYPGYADVSQL